jgi:hypothetical protein
MEKREKIYMDAIPMNRTWVSSELLEPQRGVLTTIREWPKEQPLILVYIPYAIMKVKARRNLSMTQQQTVSINLQHTRDKHAQITNNVLTMTGLHTFIVDGKNSQLAPVYQQDRAGSD